ASARQATVSPSISAAAAETFGCDPSRVWAWRGTGRLQASRGRGRPSSVRCAFHRWHQPDPSPGRLPARPGLARPTSVFAVRCTASGAPADAPEPPGPAAAAAEGGVTVSKGNESFPPAVPIRALFDEAGVRPNLSADPRRALHDAEMIFGVDVASGNEFIIYGREALARIALGRVARPVRVLRVSLDQATEELEQLIALVRVVKG